MNGVSVPRDPVAARHGRRDRPAPVAPTARGGRPVREAIAFVARNPDYALLFTVFTVVGTARVQLRGLAAQDRRRALRRSEAVRLAAHRHQRRQSRGIALHRRACRAADALLLRVAGGARRRRIAVSWSPTVWVAFVAALPLGAAGAPR
ncbi:MAG: hypothetical protein R2713_22850 [Ilumatobacteraceae bacterium]